MNSSERAGVLEIAHNNCAIAGTSQESNPIFVRTQASK